MAAPGLSFQGTSRKTTGHFWGEDIGYTKNNQDTTTASNKISGATSQQNVAGTSTNEQTTEQGISQEGLNFMLSSLLGGNQGLAQLVSGEKAAGVYNSATTSLLASDLITRAAGEVAERNVKTQTSGSAANTQASAGSSTGFENAFGNTNTSGITTHDIVNQGNQSQVTNETTDKGGSVVCTHLHSKKLLSPRLYYISARKHKNSKITMIGYHYWAIPYVLRMRKNDGLGQKMEKFIHSLVIGRAKWICGERTAVGFIAQYILRPINWLVGVSVILAGADKKNYETLYRNNRAEA